MLENNDNFFGQPIYGYSRAQAIEDGILVDVTVMAKRAGFKISVAVTYAVWDAYIKWSDKDSAQQTRQDQSGRLWDILSMFRFACRNNQSDHIIYKLKVVPRNGRAKAPVTIKLKGLIGGGDNGEPVITIMLPEED